MGQNDSKPSTPDEGGRRPSNSNLPANRAQQMDFARLIDAAPPRPTTITTSTATRYTASTSTTTVRQSSEPPRGAAALSLLRNAALKNPSAAAATGIGNGSTSSGPGAVEKNPVVYLETGAVTLSGTEVIMSAGTQSGNLRIGDRVVWLIQGSAKRGRVQKLMKIRDQVVAGVEFDTPWILNGSGYLQFKMIFLCGENRGAWISLALLIREQDYDNQGTGRNSSTGSASSSTESSAAASTRKERIQSSNLPSSKPKVPTPPSTAPPAQANSSGPTRPNPSTSASSSRFQDRDVDSLNLRIQGINIDSNINASVTVSTSSGNGSYTFTATTSTSSNNERADRAPKVQKPIPAHGSTSNQSNASSTSSKTSASEAQPRQPRPGGKGNGGGGPQQNPKPRRPPPPRVKQPSTSAAQRPDLLEQIEAFGASGIQDPPPLVAPGPSHQYQGGHQSAPNVNVYTPLTVDNPDEEEEQPAPRNSNDHRRGGRGGGGGRGQRGNQRFNRGKHQHHPYARRDGSHNSSFDSNDNQSPQRGGYYGPRGRGGHHGGGHSGEGGRGRGHYERGRGRGQRGGNSNNQPRGGQNRNNDNGGDPNNSFETSGDFSPVANQASKKPKSKVSKMECPVCFERYQVPVHQCSNGHQICNVCVTRVRECPQCRVKMDPENKIRCLIMDQLLTNESLG